jgi:hypothetical protein
MLFDDFKPDSDIETAAADSTAVDKSDDVEKSSNN